MYSLNVLDNNKPESSLNNLFAILKNKVMNNDCNSWI